MAMRVAISARTRLVKPGSALGSKITLGNPERMADEHHRPRGISAHAKGRGKMMAAQDGQRIPKRRPQQQNIVSELRHPHPFQTGGANQFQLAAPLAAPGAIQCRAACPRKSRPSMHRAGAIPAPRRSPGSRGRPCRRRQSAISTRRFPGYPRTPSPVCWLIFRSTPVAKSMTKRLEPP